jgi:predicted anti-sigma-YlaC factor YlaD
VSGGVGKVIVYGLNLSIGDFGAIAFGEELEDLNGSVSNSIAIGAVMVEDASLKD